MDRVLLATDGSEYARSAAKRAIELAAKRGATLHVICVVDERRFDEPALGSAELGTIYADDHAARSIDDVAALADPTTVQVETDIRHGIPHEVVLDYADEIDADLIVIGEHGEHDEHFAGVGQAILEHSDRRVRVVEAEDR